MSAGRLWLGSVFLVMATTGPCWAEQSAGESAAVGQQPTVMLPKTGFGPEDLAVIVNDADPLSVEIATYYQKKRGIPQRNLIHVRFNAAATVMEPVEFGKIKAEVDEKTPREVQAYALTWVKPFRVGCMSITTAFAAGFDKKYCAEGCALTQTLPYFNSASRAPFNDYGLRPTMSIAAQNFEEARKLIDRGVESDRSFPSGTAYLLDTSDRARNVRVQFYGELMRYLKGWLKVQHVQANLIEHKPDVLFYFTGLAKVDGLTSNTFVPGAIADHLTSAGGMLTGSEQMSSLRWLEAGATGSYGAVVEPCNFPAKFPNPAIVTARYAAGESLIEAYWKSVAMPGQGIFIGEPLARPFGGYMETIEHGDISIVTYLPPGVYSVFSADSAVGPYRAIARAVFFGRGRQEIKLENAKNTFYKIVPDRPLARGREKIRKEII